MEQHRVARLEVPGQDLVGRRVGVDVGHGLVARAAVVVVGAVVEQARIVELAPAVGAGDEARADRSGNRVEGQPDADGLLALHAVVGHVVVPDRGLGGAGLLDQHVLVEDLDPFGAHQAAGDRRRRRAKHEVAVFRDPLPVAVVLEEAALAVVQLVLCPDRSRLGHVALHPARQRGDPVGEDARQADGAGPPIGLDLGVRKQLVLIIRHGMLPFPAGLRPRGRRTACGYARSA